ncbi:MAG: C40 family peptidase [Oscillospiraceae bacterium]|nr:C40 family peptidase [Oscillospiraceae bacterium]
MANDENNIEISQEEKRKRDYLDDLDAQKAKELIDKINKQREETLKRHRDKMNAAEMYKSYGSHGLDFSGHEQHGINEVKDKIHSAELNAQPDISPQKDKQISKLTDKLPSRSANSECGVIDEEYIRQMTEHHRERRELEHDKGNSIRSIRNTPVKTGDKTDEQSYIHSDSKLHNKAVFSSYGFGKVVTNHIENGTITFSGNKHISEKVSEKPNITSTNTFNSSLPIKKSDYTTRTLDNSRQNYIRQSPITVQNSVSDLSEKKVRFQYAKRYFGNAAHTTERIYTTAGRSVYRVSSQRGDYDTIHNFEQMRRGAVGTVAAIHVINNIPRHTAARIAVIDSYTKATLGNMSRYIKGSNSAKILTEVEEMRKFVGPLSVRQRQRYEFLENELKKNAPINIVPTTLTQLRTEMSRVFTSSQYKDLAGKYGGLVKLSLPEIKKQITVLNEKQQLGTISDFQQRKLQRLGELKEIYMNALRENGQLMKLSASRVGKEIRILQKLKKSGGLNAAQKIRLEKLTELSSLHNLKGKIYKDIHARRELSIAFSHLIHQAMSKTEDSGINGLFMATDICTNRYTRIIVREITKLEKFTIQKTAHLGAMGIKKISDKTGLTKQINTLKTKATKKLMNTKPVAAVNKLKGKVNGEIYSEVRKKISSKTPAGLKTAAKKTKSTVGKIRKTSNKVSNTVRRGYEIVTKPFVKTKSAIIKVTKAAKGAVLVAGGFLLVLYIIIAFTSVISSATSSIILEDVSYLNEYIAVLNKNQTEFKEKLAALGAGYKNVTYSYTNGSKMNNTREIMCMATVYFQQDFSDKDSIKAYLTQMFNASHFYSTQESDTYYCSEGEACDNKKTEEKEKPDGSKETVYSCLGHKDLNVTITALAFDEIFNASLNATGVGDLCFAFETGGQTLGSYDCWYCEDIGDGAGMNYGMMSTNRSQARSMWNYIKANSANFAQQFEGIDGFTGNNLYPFSSAFNHKWQGNHSPEDTAEMEQLQRAWVWNAYGTIWCTDLQSRTGVDMTRSWALSEVALSRAVHRGAYSARVFSSCINSSMTDEQIIDAIYDYECSHLSSFMSRWNLERNYAKSFLGREFPSDDSEQFSWTDDNIEWCKNLYEQNWEELYEGLVGLNSATVGSSMSDAEVEALIGSLDGLSEERKHLLSWACSAVGVIPYHWDWRSYWTIDADDWGSVATPDYKGRNLKGLDCSGFVIWCYNKAGYDPVTCGWGAKGYTGTIADTPQTIKISYTDLKPGDIGMAGAWPYTHTGIYAGNGKWIHCTGAPTNNTVINSYGGFTTFYRLINLD